jgi:hypothetical protein
MHMAFWLQNLKKVELFGNVNIDGRMLLKWFIIKPDMRVWTGCIWLSLGTSGSCANMLYEPLVL